MSDPECQRVGNFVADLLKGKEMGLVASQKNGGSSEPIEAGLYQAVCYAVIDIGTQYNERFNKYNRKCVIIWELPDVRIEIDRDGDKLNLPRARSKRYTISLHEKSNLYQDLVSWRGKNFTGEELAGFDLFNIAGKNCMLNIVNEQKGDRTYDKISGVAKLMKNLEPKDPENPVVTYSISDHGTNIPENVPDWVKHEIKQSEEWKRLTEKSAPDNPPATDETIPDDEIPF